jgi:hypothetical protein
MKKMDSLQYSLKTFRYDQLWLPISFCFLFMIVMLINRRPESYYLLSRVYLGVVIPLVGGVLSAYALLEDPTLELRFASPEPSSRLLLERVGQIFLISAFCAGIMQVFDAFVQVDLSALGNIWHIQLVWLIPSLALMGLGTCLALMGKNSLNGVICVSLIWLIELLLRGWFAQNSIGKYFLLFMGALIPDSPSLEANQLVLFVFSCLLFSLSCILFNRQERYL